MFFYIIPLEIKGDENGCKKTVQWHDSGEREQVRREQRPLLLE